LPLFGKPDGAVLDPRIEGALPTSFGDRTYEKYLKKVATKEQRAILEALETGEVLVFLGNGEGLGHADYVLHMSAIVITNRRLLIIRGGKIRQALLLDQISQVTAGAGNDGRPHLYVTSRSETIGFQFESRQRRDTLRELLGFNPGA
jgi:hypothetical protein